MYLRLHNIRKNLNVVLFLNMVILRLILMQVFQILLCSFFTMFPAFCTFSTAHIDITI